MNEDIKHLWALVGSLGCFLSEEFNVDISDARDDELESWASQFTPEQMDALEEELKVHVIGLYRETYEKLYQKIFTPQ